MDQNIDDIMFAQPLYKGCFKNMCVIWFYCSLFQCVDWWSVGVLTYELLTGASPFTVEGEKNSQSEITK